jgi:superfamily II DNA/RNA helicase
MYKNRRYSSSVFSTRKKFGARKIGSHSSGSNYYSRYIKKAEPIIEQEYISKYKFSDFPLDTRLQQNIVKKGYTQTMPIQDQAIPYILEGKDLMGIANTGMGKTAAFLVPLIQKMIKDRNQKVLIIAPTRELAEQIDSEFIFLSQGMGMRSVVVIGGASMNNQIWKLKKPWNVVVGTPGRLKDLINRKALNLSVVSNLVVDEVDRMFDMGFSKDVQTILKEVNPARQSLYFSATMNSSIESLVNSYSRDAVKVSVKVRDTAASVEQDIVKVMGEKSKITLLHDILISEEVTKTLIFARTKFGVEKLSIELKKRGFKVDSIHGNKTQFQRQKVLNMFKQDYIKILVATDVAARGLDIPNVSHVINYEVPEKYDDYIHRIGRTGRGNKSGKALTFV